MSQYTLFVSDVHLKQEDPGRNKLFMSFLEEVAPKAQALYILGDLFDAWLGDDDPDPVNKTAAKALQECASKIPVHYVLGNHDFLMSKHFFSATNLNKLPDFFTLDLYGQNVLLTHGDVFCTHAHLFQLVRKLYHSTTCKKIFLALPLLIRRGIAIILKNQEKKKSRPLSKKFSLDLNTMLEIMKQEHTAMIIHGHTHVPKIVDLKTKIDDKEAIEASLPPWSAQKGGYLKYFADGNYLLETFEK